ncbi:hypothetical protein [Micromonospora globbae]|uniref:hypothetical protein n=1 Tax=Micromonospora globbae TaxID=1894969 RepID=UPI003444A43F
MTTHARPQRRPPHRARDRAGRFNPGLQQLVDAGLATPSRISPHAPVDPASLEPGDEVYLGWIRELFPHERQPADLYVIGCLWWGDYTGDDVARSNHRSLRRDFAGDFVGLYDAVGAVGLALQPGCRNDTLVTALLGLRDYPLYDEDDNGALIVDLADEAWDGWLRLDVPAMLRDEHGIDADDIGVDDDALREMFYRIHGERFGDEYAENAVRVVFPSLAATVAAMATELRARRGS